MQRDLLSALLKWRNHPLRKPLILKGARQVGKSWLVREFGKEFPDFVEINFDKDKSAASLFEGDLHIQTLIEKLSLYCQKKIIPGETLLFLDEIQECEAALSALRYFKEDLPALHVIAAGSLLDFVLNELGMPVGRVQFMHLYPLSFAEFLTVGGYEALRKHLKENQKIDTVFHEKLIELVKNYFWLGGMPAVLDAWLKLKDPKICHEVQDEVVEAYRQDFHKYVKDRQISFVTRVFDAIPAQLGHKFKFSHVEQDEPAHHLKNALTLLIKAGIAHFCYHTSASGFPLGAEKDEKKFKVFFFDIGIAERILRLDIKKWVTTPFKISNLGPITEQFVAQELLAYSNIHQHTELFYWHREAKSSNAEVDFLISQGENIIPVEVKSSTQGSMKSMRLFLNSHPQVPYGIKISEGIFAGHSGIKEIPLYALEGLHPFHD